LAPGRLVTVMSSETLEALALAAPDPAADPDPAPAAELEPAAEPEVAATLPQAVAAAAQMAAISRYRAPVRAAGMSWLMSHWTRACPDRFRLVVRPARLAPVARRQNAGDLGLYQARATRPVRT
jgi:hypothetical protein